VAQRNIPQDMNVPHYKNPSFDAKIAFLKAVVLTGLLQTETGLPQEHIYNKGEFARQSRNGCLNFNPLNA